MRLALPRRVGLAPLLLALLLVQCGLVLAQDAAASGTTSDLAAQKAEADRLFAAGEYAAASRAYGRAIDSDPTAWQLRYRRATAYISLGRHSAAIDDLDAIVRLNPAFGQAHLQKARLLAKEGQFGEAEEEVGMYLKKGGKGGEVDELLVNLKSAEAALSAARTASKRKEYPACVEQSTRALEVGPNSLELREMRLACEEGMGDLEAVVGDLSRLAHLVPSNARYSLRLAHLQFFLDGAPTALQHIKNCLHYDPESKACKRAHKRLRALDKDIGKARNFVDGGSWRPATKLLAGPEGLIKRLEAALDEAVSEGVLPASADLRARSAPRLALYQLACKAYVGLNQAEGMRTYCTAVLGMPGGADDVDALVGMGDIALKEENWEEAVRRLGDAFEKGGRSSQEILNKLQRAQKLLKQSKSKDYYKVLGVSRDADQRTIKKAYRTAAKTAHPDVGGSEAKMAALNEAYEVLSNDELRARFDQGDDPNDPSGGHGHGGNPFAHHGGGMPFQQFFQQQGGGGGFPGGNPFMFQQQQGGGGRGGGQKMHFQWAG